MNEELEYEWDEAKRELNLARHGVDFTLIELFDWDYALTLDQLRDNETRHLSYAPVSSRLYALVWTLRGKNVRIISFRKANKREVMAYEKAQNAN